MGWRGFLGCGNKLAARTLFVVRHGSRAHGKYTLPCVKGTWRTAKPYSIYDYFNLIVIVKVLKLSNRSEKFP
jgi:hypothetical protein